VNPGRLGSGAALGAAVALLASCGGSSASSTPTSVVHSYVSALASDDGTTACSLLTGEVKQRLVRGAAALALLGHGSAGVSCPDALRNASSLLGADQVAELHKAKIALASQTGRQAIVHVTLPNGHVGSVPVENTAAGWLVTAAPGSLLGRGEVEREALTTYEQQLAANEIASVTVNKAPLHRGIKVTLKDGRHVFVRYPLGTLSSLRAALSERGVPITFVSLAQAEREAGEPAPAESPAGE
jgi:hypothetical protein